MTRVKKLPTPATSDDIFFALQIIKSLNQEKKALLEKLANIDASNKALHLTIDKLRSDIIYLRQELDVY